MRTKSKIIIEDIKDAWDVERDNNCQLGSLGLEIKWQNEMGLTKDGRAALSILRNINILVGFKLIPTLHFSLFHPLFEKN